MFSDLKPSQTPENSTMSKTENNNLKKKKKKALVFNFKIMMKQQ